MNTSERSIIDAAIQLIRDKVNHKDEQQAITGHEYAADLLKLSIGHLEREEFWCIWLDTKHRIIHAGPVATGTLSACHVYPREIAREALNLNASAVIVSHNHPSGDHSPSTSDLKLTERLKNVFELLEVRLLDHIIIGGANHYSFADHGLYHLLS